MNSRQFLFLILMPATLIAQEARDVVPLKNWSNPLYWRASQAEREATGAPSPQLQFSPTQVSPNALSFVAITPCRLLDTRGTATGFSSGAPWNAPIAAAGTLTIPVQTDAGNAACGTIPSSAQAYSVNITLIPVSSGQVNFLSIWPAGATQPVVATMNDKTGLILANAAIVPAGTPSGGISVFNSGPSATNVVIDMNGFFAAPSDLNGNTAIGAGTMLDNTSGQYNTALGLGVLQNNTTGSNNSASGYGALFNNTTGGGNTASGAGTMFFNTTGSNNTASGFAALNNNTTGSNNTANGQAAMKTNTTGGSNTAVGSQAMMNNNAGGSAAVGANAMQMSIDACCDAAFGTNALQNNTFGQQDTALGGQALINNTTGNGNIAVGFNAASSVSGGNSNNIEIGNTGAAGDSGVIRIGTSDTQSSFFAAGVNGVTTGNNDAVAVVIDSNGQLGTVSSSARFKEDIHDMGEASDRLLDLRPVTFRYRQAYKDGSKPIDYGLIAEEVAQVYPDLVVKDPDGKVQTVQYQKLTPMLLNEVQKQADEIRSLRDRLAAIEALLTGAAEPAHR